MLDQHRGLDVNKRINGGPPMRRKRELLVDTDGRLWVVAVQAAHQAEGPASIPLITDMLWRAGERLEKRSVAAGVW